jgi:hypothetical protein
MAEAYASKGYFIRVSNNGAIYDRNASQEKKRAFLQKAFNSHWRQDKNYWSMDYYIVSKGQSTSDAERRGEARDIATPLLAGTSVTYAKGGGYGLHMIIKDKNGEAIIKQGHGDRRTATPAGVNVPLDGTVAVTASSGVDSYGSMAEDFGRDFQAIMQAPRNFFDEATSILSAFGGYIKQNLLGDFQERLTSALRRGVTQEYATTWLHKNKVYLSEQGWTAEQAKAQMPEGGAPSRFYQSSNYEADRQKQDTVSVAIAEGRYKEWTEQQQQTVQRVSELKGRLPANLVAAFMSAQENQEAQIKEIVEKEKQKIARRIRISAPTEAVAAGDVNYTTANNDSPAKAKEVQKTGVIAESKDGRTIIKVEYRESPGSELYDLADPWGQVDSEVAVAEPQRASRDSISSNQRDSLGRPMNAIS